MTKVSKENLSAMEIREARMRVAYKILPVVSVVLLVLLWLFAANSGGTFPSPVEVWDRTVQLFEHPVKNRNLIIHVLASLKRVGIALAFDWTFGIAFGVMIGWFPKLRAFFSPLFDAFRAIPPLAWIPLITLWNGAGELSKIIIVIRIDIRT